MNIVDNILALEKSESRRGHDINAIVIHSMAGFYRSTISWFNRPDVLANAHYLISKEGEISKCVEEERAAWHSGEVTVNYENAPKPFKDKWGVNPNLYTIGIEMEDENNPQHYYPQKQYFACVELTADILERHGLEASKDTIIMHKTINPKYRSDPIGDWDHDRFIRDVKASMGGNKEPGVASVLYKYETQIQTANWVSGLNIRVGASLSFDTVKQRGLFGILRDKMLTPGEVIKVIGFVKGERVFYNSINGKINTQFWWVTPENHYLWSGGTAWLNGSQVKLTLKDFPKSIDLQSN